MFEDRLRSLKQAVSEAQARKARTEADIDSLKTQYANQVSELKSENVESLEEAKKLAEQLTLKITENLALIETQLAKFE